MPASPVIQYREVLSLRLFDCEALHASLSPQSCAERWRNPGDGTACVGCSLGAHHAGAKQPQENAAPTKVCLRCGELAPRVLGRILCPSCWNRSRECLTRLNAKGRPPAKWAALLHQAVAVVAIDNPLAALGRLYGGEHEHSDLPPLQSDELQRRRSRRMRGGALPCVPCWEQLDAGHLWLEFITTGATEVAAAVARLLPGAEVIELELGPSFTEQWQAFVADGPDSPALPANYEQRQADCDASLPKFAAPRPSDEDSATWRQC